MCGSEVWGLAAHRLGDVGLRQGSTADLGKAQWGLAANPGGDTWAYRGEARQGSARLSDDDEPESDGGGSFQHRIKAKVTQIQAKRGGPRETSTACDHDNCGQGIVTKKYNMGRLGQGTGSTD